jgi:hypothetical protein
MLALGGGSALLNWLGGRSQADAAKDAAAMQAQSAREALDLQRQQWKQTQANLTPYMQAGAGGLTALTSLLGVAPNMAAGAPPAMSPSVSMAGPISGPPGTSATTPNMPGGISADELYAWRRNRTQAGRSSLLTNAGERRDALAFGGHVLLRAPNGQTQAVPANQVDFYLSRGATRV